MIEIGFAALLYAACGVAFMRHAVRNSSRSVEHPTMFWVGSTMLWAPVLLCVLAEVYLIKARGR